MRRKKMEEERNMKWELNDDGGSFDRILREAEEAANVDESFKMSSLVRMIVQRCWKSQQPPAKTNLTTVSMKALEKQNPIWFC